MTYDPDCTPRRRGITQPVTDEEVSARLAAQGEWLAAAIHAEFGALRKELVEIKATLNELKDKGEER